MIHFCGYILRVMQRKPELLQIERYYRFFAEFLHDIPLSER